MKKSLSFCPSHSSESGWSAVTRDDGNSADDRPADPGEPPPPPPPPEAPAAPPERPPTPEPECPPPKAAAATKTATRSSSLDTLRQRHRGKAALSRRKDRKATNLDKRISGSPCAALRRPRLLTHWMYRCRWTLLCTYLVALFCVLSMTFFLWKLQDGASEP
ncbi:actin cytoskeleton-regulatory complex protein pan1-like [Salarias fasciatus]|uniref:actin cytoskeleton-regulatory complex protein pan1-like n=1 Tax=Salarias fasciatus TaxID=181472 RepID=UPI001176FD16|nr:actin cytoskeleton-regulatory complex protein pan1-like [Salarias fasciatus]